MQCFVRVRMLHYQSKRFLASPSTLSLSKGLKAIELPAMKKPQGGHDFISNGGLNRCQQQEAEASDGSFIWRLGYNR
jgi:hypothetical protein